MTQQEQTQRKKMKHDAKMIQIDNFFTFIYRIFKINYLILQHILFEAKLNII